MSRQNTVAPHASKRRLFANLTLLSLAIAPTAYAETSASGPEGSGVDHDEIVVTGYTAPREQRPTTAESRSAEEIQVTTNVTNAEDSLRYFPNIFVRKRHIGDTQAPITTRTSWGRMNGDGQHGRTIQMPAIILLQI
jgi:iron complex outermembrane receptor protein